MTLFLCSESTFLCLDATAWTAIATIVVGILGLYGAFWKPLASWIWKPILRLEVERLADHSDLSHDRRMFVLRIPVSNRARRRAATDIEVFLESIQRQHADRRFELPTYLPVRLLWCHGQSAICDRIAGGAYRLLDLGYITSQRGTYDPATDKTEQTDLNELGFRTEISSRFPVHLPIGSYTLQFLVITSSTTQRQRINVTVRSEYLHKNLPLANYLDVKPT